VPRLGETLRAQREKKGITLEQAASDTRIREKFLKGLEDSDYQTLPGTVYTKGFLRNYAEYLELPTEELVVQFHQERDLPEAPRTFKPLSPIARRSLIFTPAVLVPVVVLAGIALFVGYLYYQFVSFAVPPKIDITDPPADAIAQSADFVVKGKTVPEGRVTVQVFPGPLTVADIHPNSDGTFSVNVQLNPGSNHLIVEVLDTTGKVGRASRTVRLETTSTTAQPITVIMSVKGGEAWVQATVDGAVVPGTGRVFKDGETATYTGREVRLRSTNGAATMVSYNGRPAAAMGQAGETVERIYTAQ
jgi:cytoskeletal protein RodZ